MVPYRDVPLYINASNICVAPFAANRDEKVGLSPLKIHEYMACGKPVIGSNLPPTSRYVGDARGILVDPTSIDEIANAMIYLLEHPEEAKRMGENGRRAVKEKYNWGKMEERLLNFYDVIENK